MFLRRFITKKEKTRIIYNQHEAKVYCINKDKEHKKYDEFSSKACHALTKTTGIIVSSYKFQRKHL